ncbi:NADPH2:quinone reductase [Pedobacter westerhofensis]|uniref:Zinc-type alcohol dehydrogenase-like protein n=1 Tax=Pedobacter westerhofensis TaxID=425512 RepID=A0A521AFI3_9SPHI|nr:zinc-binding alcohol dehydrogenase family protein [Pedobacter westerhofensis]SMO33559.1 NADPH2:quinone reductase [Pedobacter westerhofensis]
MKAIGFKQSLNITEQDSFVSFETDVPQPSGRDILVKVKAISVNPVDYKIRQGSAKDVTLDQPKIIGWDAAGTVEAVGEEVSAFKIGDEVYYAGDLKRSGCNAEYQLVDERIVGKKPSSLSYEAAAAMPLTTLTAWEMLFERFAITGKDKGKSILIIGGAGGVGSIATQLAKNVAGLVVISTASRPETADWCRSQGADHVVNHKDLINEVRNAGFQYVDFIMDCVNLNFYWDAFAELIKPQGKIGSISDPKQPVNLVQLKSKSVSFHWELMFTRSSFQTEDMVSQSNILNSAAELFDQQSLKSTLNNTLQGFSVANLKEAHQLLESGKAIGKTVIMF